VGVEQAEETEQLVARLEAELAQKQALVDARLVREKAQLDELAAQKAELTAQREAEEAELIALAPKRDALLQLHTALLANGSRGSPPRAAFWSTIAVALTAGAIVPLASLPKDISTLGVAAGGAIALALGWLLADQLGRKPE
jgi:hypothetical protein